MRIGDMDVPCKKIHILRSNNDINIKETFDTKNRRHYSLTVHIFNLFSLEKSNFISCNISHNPHS